MSKGRKPSAALAGLRRLTQERGGLGSMTMVEWVVVLQAQEYGRELKTNDIVTAIRNELKRGCMKYVRGGVYEARSKEEMERLRVEQKVAALKLDPTVDASSLIPLVEGESRRAVEAAEVKRFEEWEGEMMPCERVMKLCYQGESCCNAERCSAARGAGFKTMEERLTDPNVKVVYSWGGGMCGVGRAITS